MLRELKRFHPLSQLVFISGILAVILIINDPVILLCSLVISLVYTFAFGGWSVLRSYILLTLISAVGIMIINPLISHRGITVLFYLPDGNPLTLESIYYGAAAAALISSTINWFYTVSKALDSRRIVFLFGIVSPKLAILLSMALGFVPKFRRKLTEIRASRKVMGRDITDGCVHGRLRNSAYVMSSLIGSVLENSVDTADSMTSRGYGLTKRSSYSNFRITSGDVIFIICELFCLAVILICYYSGGLDFSYYPTFSAAAFTSVSLSLYLLFFIMCCLPLGICIKENLKWKFIRSGI